ncbi:MAG: hypothetical protein OEV56_06390 [Dehalococcoidia bacterium]|jgi:hypothetical protein|nr:hypothetical protein [Dehalococcoidia bacterium]
MARKADPNIQQHITRKRMSEEIFLNIVDVYAKEGHFHLGKLTNEKQLRLIAQHLRGVARILTQEYLEETSND